MWPRVKWKLLSLRAWKFSLMFRSLVWWSEGSAFFWSSLPRFSVSLMVSFGLICLEGLELWHLVYCCLGLWLLLSSSLISQESCTVKFYICSVVSNCLNLQSLLSSSFGLRCFNVEGLWFCVMRWYCMVRWHSRPKALRTLMFQTPGISVAWCIITGALMF
jgi:hypothetical protein